MSEADPLARAAVTDGLVMAETPVPQDRRERLSAQPGGARAHVARGMLINSAFSVALQGLTVLRGFLVAAFIAPSDYGVWAILMIGYTAIFRLKAVGIADRYIQRDEPDDKLAFQKAFTLQAILNGSLWLLLMLATPLLALAYDVPEIVAPGLVVLLAMPANILQTPIWVYTREMDFKRQRTLSSVDPVVGVLVTVAGAVGGLGYWSFVAGTVAGSWAGAVAILRHAHYPLGFRYDRATAREYLGFSWPVFVSNLGNSILLQGTTLVARFTVGLAGIGSMALANSIRLYIEFADGIITTTMYPAVCAVKEQRDLLFESFVKSNRLALMWGVPVGVGVALFADDFASYLLGGEWSDAVILFQAVGLVSALGHAGFNWTAYVRALGNTRPIAKYTWIVLVGWAVGPVPLMIVDGLRGYSIGLFVIALLTLATRAYFVRAMFPRFRLLPHLLRALAPTIPALAVVLGVRAVGPLPRSLLVAVGELVLYLGVTVVATWLAEKALLREAVGYLKRARASAV